MQKDERGAIAEGLREQQVTAHLWNLPWVVAGSAAVALILVVIQWGSVPPAYLLGWFGGVLLALGLRSVNGVLGARSRPGAAPTRTWLWRHRAGFLAHGIAWGLATLLPVPEGDLLRQAALVIVLAGLTATSFSLTSFDLPAALLFGVPVLGMLSLHLLAQGSATHGALAVLVVAALLFLSFTARRAQGVMRKYVALRVAEASQAEALRASENLLARTGATAGVGGWELDVATQGLRLTAQTCRIHAIDPALPPDLAGYIGHYPGECQDAIRAAFDVALRDGRPFDLELPLAGAAGRPRWVRLIGQPHGAPGAVLRVSGVVQEITQAKNAELALAEKHHLLSLLVQTTSEGYWFVDTDGLTTDVNRAMCDILARPRDEIVGKSIFAFVDAENAAVFRSEIQRRAEGHAGGYEIRLQRPDGSAVDCHNNATPIFDTAGQRIGSIGMWTDISARKRTEQQLRATSEQLRHKTQALQDTLDSISQGLVSLDAQGHATVYNRRVLEMLDLPEALFAADKTIDDVADFQVARGDFGVDGSLVPPALRDPIARGAHGEVPELYLRETRAGLRLEVCTRHLPDGGMVRTYADVTAYFEAQQALRDSEAELRALLGAFPGCISVTDAQGRCTYVNEQFAALVGRPRPAIIGRPVQEVLGVERQARVEAALARVRAGETATYESEHAATAQRPRTFLQVTLAPGADAGGQGPIVYAFAIDISARKAAEEAAIAARDEAERANRAKSQFLSSMSHELRTPMNAILGFGQLLMSDPNNALAGRQREHLREMLRGARHLLSLINEVLDLAVVETGRLQITLEAVPVAPLLHECLALLQPLARARGIAVRLPREAARVLADRTRLKQVLLNLLSNAIKYNRTGGDVAVSCTVLGTRVRIGVSDRGPGLNAEERARLFQAFERLEAGRTEVEGAGLGLALSRGYMQAMQGEIGVESTPGEGSTFWVTLPRTEAGDAAPADEPDAAPLPLAPPAGATRTVLYIEDNPVNVLLMEAMLARLPGVRLLTAQLPWVGLRMAVDAQPDLILLDIQLPDIDGYEVLRRLRLHAASRAIPVIAVSANAMASDVEHGRAAGFADYLTKPLDLAQLLTAVAAALALSAPASSS